MPVSQKIIALYDKSSVCVYQAFGKEIAEEAMKKQFLGERFFLDRLSWIKPSFAWMLYRSAYASKPGQERILRIFISHTHFYQMLAQAIPTTQNNNLFSSGKEWRKKLQQSDVRYQWDPDRNGRLDKISRKAIQLGLEGETLRNYARKWILRIEDVTHIAKKVECTPEYLNFWPDEREYSVDSLITRNLQIK
ncbi:DUF4291 family protein [Candidatus Uabimicrobium sp. HlEnr_7]|uniref:DUF4291 family protein n=1 Tax=Candidatus Uabimicrobium helgolandensis TaxID=3095367 RepID=UPI0035576BB0